MALLAQRLGVTAERLPVLWDADFMLGELAPGEAQERYVLYEINVSSVAPYPESANAAIVAALRALSGAA